MTVGTKRMATKTAGGKSATAKVKADAGAGSALASPDTKRAHGEEAPGPVEISATAVVAQPKAAAAAGVVTVQVQDDAWSPAELDDVRAQLVMEVERLNHDAMVLQTTIADVVRDSSDGAGDDQADTGSKAYGREQELAFLTTIRESVFQAEYALRRIELGTYSQCESCGNAVGKLRLQAFPRAVLCVRCKQRQERR